MLVAYVLWFLFHIFGGHRFYSGRSDTAVCQLLLTIVGVLLLIANYNSGDRPFGLVLLVPVWIWILIDFFLIPGWIRQHNFRLAMQLIAEGAARSGPVTR